MSDLHSENQNGSNGNGDAHCNGKEDPYIKRPWLWKKGQSGNPKGRKPKERSITQAIHEILERHEFDGHTLEGGRKVAQEIAAALVRGALRGDIQFIKEVIDRTEGKAVALVEVSSYSMAEMQERMIEYENSARNGDGQQP